MTEALAHALKTLRDELQIDAHSHCVGVNVFFSSEGYEIEYRMRTPGSLKRDGVSMRNLRGLYIETEE
jgi:hypothetical protein